MATYFIILAWIIPWTEESCGLLSMGQKELDRTEWLSYTHNRHTALFKIKVHSIMIWLWWPQMMTTEKFKEHASSHIDTKFRSVQFSRSVVSDCDPMNCSTLGLPVHHQLLEFTQTLVHRVGDAIQPSHLLSSLSPPACNPSQHQSLFQWVNTSHQVAKVLEFQL